jgi:hypothetical protein
VRFQDLALKTWVSGPRYLALKTWVSGPRKLSILRSSYLFPITFLCVHHHFSFSRHFSLRPSSQTDRRTHGRSEFIYKINCVVCMSVTWQFCFFILWQNQPLHFLWQNRPAGRGDVRLWRSSGPSQKADRARPGTPGLPDFHWPGPPWGVSGRIRHRRPTGSKMISFHFNYSNSPKFQSNG